MKMLKFNYLINPPGSFLLKLNHLKTTNSFIKILEYIIGFTTLPLQFVYLVYSSKSSNIPEI